MLTPYKHLLTAVVFIYAQNVDKKYSSPLPFLPDVEQTSSILPLYNQSSLLSSLSISALEEYKGRRRLSELLLPDSGPVALEKKGKGSTLTDKVTLCMPCVMYLLFYLLLFSSHHIYHERDLVITCVFLCVHVPTLFHCC